MVDRDAGRRTTGLTSVVEALPRAIRTPAREAGGMVRLAGKVCRVAVRHPGEILRPTLDYTYVTLRRCWIPVIVSLGGFIAFLSVAALVFLNQLGAIALFPPVIFRVTIETFAVWAVALVLAGIVGASLTSELGARRVRDEIDAMRVMGVDPVRELVAPRVLSAVLLTGFMAFPTIALSLFASQLSSAYYADQGSAEFQYYAFDNIEPAQLLIVLLNCLLVGVVIGVVCAYKGMNAAGGAEGLGRAVNQAVVICFVVLWTMQTLYSGITQGVLELGRFR